MSKVVFTTNVRKPYLESALPGVSEVLVEGLPYRSYYSLSTFNRKFHFPIKEVKVSEFDFSGKNKVDKNPNRCNRSQNFIVKWGTGVSLILLRKINIDS